VLDVGVGRLAQQVAREEQPRGDARRLQVVDQRAAAEARVRADRHREAEPRRVGVGGRVGQDEDVLQVAQRLAQERVVGAPRGDELVEALQLRVADRGLHVGRLQVVAQVRVHVLVVIALGERAEALGEALAAGVVAARVTPAVAAPVADDLDDPLHDPAVGQDRAALARRDVVGGVERQRRQLAERADRLAVVGGAERVAAVLDQQQAVAAAEVGDRAEVERVAERVGDDDRARLV
jgi:hypothetical protein